MKKAFLIYVEGSDSTNSNKYYNMEQTGDNFTVTYGRVGSTKTEYTYPMNKWNQKLRSK